MITTHELPGVRALTFMSKVEGTPSGAQNQEVDLLFGIQKWLAEHPDVVLLRIEFDQWDDCAEIVSKTKPADALLTMLNLHPLQRSGELPSVTWTATATLYYEGLPTSELVDGVEKGWVE